ncbi:Arylsulfatase [Limihaloglobus sulfuriphilus]|uniref:Arylsulfatase n=1 Tax=Limihaloglobus sulfuriphilus TaxID=1851148 RepID=A0A1Q2MED0_9BACT|nr:sulfatase-like hydrolase/transferase [Limihaloglobus sulfuriphilus]AQQ71063.1 Arylsulfatase [Limihaloglobus sulfuriphilus]
MKQPNIVFIITDQQRYDTINAHGYGHMITPNMDRLANEGVSFTSAFAPGATCVASRAAIFTGMYPHNTGVYSFNRWAHQNTWVTDLADNGYHCVNIGKMHCDPIFAQNGFHERWVAENKCQDFEKFGLAEDDWGKFLIGNGLKRPLNRAEMYSDWDKKLNAVPWEYEERYHVDSFVGDTAVKWLNNWDQRKSLFLEIGFPGPHEPYDPPQRFIDMYEDADIPEHKFSDDEFSKKPKQQRTLQQWFKNTPHNAVINYEDADAEDVKKMRKHYCANITLIDEKIGQLLESLETNGMLENTVLIFTSDHGDSLGDHKLPYKWLMYDPMNRVPFMIKDFRKPNKTDGKKIDDLVSLIDIGPTILNYTKTETPVYLEGRPLNDYVEKGSIEAPCQYVFCEDNYLMMIRSKTHKMVYYIDQEYGELYDLTQDPHELSNLWDDEKYKMLKMELKCRALDWIAKSCYFNGGYKQTKSRDYKIRWPEKDGFGLYLQGRPDMV